MSALICGSLAYDTIMVFPGRFREHILPEKVHILNVAFRVAQIRREFGGCAGNIAYNLHMLGGEGQIMATVGSDFGPYTEWIEQCGLSQRYIRKIGHESTAQAFVTTDLDDNQITAFHPGAMDYSHENEVPRDGSIRIAIISPDGRQGMLAHARQCHEAGIPFIFDPGQGLPMFNGDELCSFIEQASYICVNDYESQLLQERTGLAMKRIAEQVEALIVTYGSQGSAIFTQGRRIEIPAVRADSVADPTGCGDAYRGGLLFGLVNGLDWEVSGRIAALISAIKVVHPGAQNHSITSHEFRKRYEQEFGHAF